jgi:hypothetical protein
MAVVWCRIESLFFTTFRKKKKNTIHIGHAVFRKDSTVSFGYQSKNLGLKSNNSFFALNGNDKDDRLMK